MYCNIGNLLKYTGSCLDPRRSRSVTFLRKDKNNLLTTAMDKIRLLTFLMILVQATVEAKKITSNKEKLAAKLTADGYSSEEPPRLDSATEVKVGMYVHSMTPQTGPSGDFSIVFKFYLRQSWNDPRLAFDPDSEVRNKVRVSEDKIDSMWVPDLFFRNGKEFSTNKDKFASELMTVSNNGDCCYVRDIIVGSFFCPVHLQKYPFDTQQCSIMIESFGYTMDTMYYGWLPSPVDIDTDMDVTPFTLQDEILYDCSQNYTAGAFPCLQISFVLRRNSGYHVVQLFLPTMLIVAISWLVFWIRLDAIQTRVILGLFTVVVMATVASVSFSFMPRSSYVKAVDVWLATCAAFVLAALLTVFAVEFLYRRKSKSPEADTGTEKTAKTDVMTSLEMTPQSRGTEGKKRPLAQQINKYSRVGFPLMFLLFNIIYWIVYRLPPKSPTTD